MCEFRTVKGYIPAEHMIRTKFEDGKESLYLPAAERIKWFNTYKSETGISGTINEEEAQMISTPVGSVWVVDASVTLGEERYRGRFMRPVLNGEGNLDERAFSTAYTKAIGRALAHAGFGQDEDDLRDGHDQSPLSDAPIVIGTADVPVRNPVPEDPVSAPVPIPGKRGRKKAVRASETAISAETESEESKKAAETPEGMTIEAAKAVVIDQVPLRRKDLVGKSMNEMLVNRPGFITYVCGHEEMFDNLPEVVKAAKVLCPLIKAE